ncbi:hypothetical protein ACN4GJ_28035, partial [Burkholderia pseudomallei]
MLGRAAAAAAPRSLADAPPATPERAPIPSSRIAPKPPVARSTSRTPAHASPTCKLLPFFDIDTRRMMQVPQRSALGGPTLIRLLARLARQAGRVLHLGRVPDARFHRSGVHA